ncbi:unnamed protein product [Periconia digitata]|uniref:Uncharacterized protein n=1 Tax=Periconia digitata TaxID=1303443 RepID=A0A9W4UH86_9PLEO|nr:unnamed protein product [Periconia digitata]
MVPCFYFMSNSKHYRPVIICSSQWPGESIHLPNPTLSLRCRSNHLQSYRNQTHDAESFFDAAILCGEQVCRMNLFIYPPRKTKTFQDIQEIPHSICAEEALEIELGPAPS